MTKSLLIKRSCSMGKILNIIIIISLVLVSSSIIYASSISDMADVVYMYWAKIKPFPVLSSENTLDESTAYLIQKAFVNRVLDGQSTAGFKAGITTIEAQKRFGVNGPVGGVLYPFGKKSDNARISMLEFAKVMIETEIAFFISSSIDSRVSNIEELKSKIGSIAPAIELPDLAYQDMKTLKGVDIIASNVSARQFIIGSPVPFCDVNPNDITVTLTRAGNLVNSGKGDEALGNQFEAAIWLVNRMIENGWSIEAGHVLLTGALGKMIPGDKGKYIADYGALGKLSFEIE